jgi:hypothetical protein
MLCGVSMRLGAPPSSSTIRVRCRDFTFVAFTFADDKTAREVFDFIKYRTCRVPSIDKLYAFKHNPPPPERAIDGWRLYDARAEFRRQGISEKLVERGWRISTINKDYTFCSTYPAVLAVPSAVSDNVLKYARQFRSMHRIPALTYLHPVNNCAISRSSQPAIGWWNNSNLQDEKLVRACFSATESQSNSPLTSQHDALDEPVETTQQALPETDELVVAANPMFDEKTGKRLIYGAQQSNVIYDARPQTNAEANRIHNGGSENMSRYFFATKIFLNIPNIHGVRKSLLRATSALQDTDILSSMPATQPLDTSSWLEYISCILRGSASIARKVGIEHSNVLVHCSDGWDRTSQLCALAQIMLDPYFRTIDGFIVLVEKDFLSFGHMFRLRAGHLNHESWFTVEKDTTGAPREPQPPQEGQGDVLQNAIGSISSWWAKKMDDKGSESDSILPEDAVPQEHKEHIGNQEATSLKNVSPVFHQFLDCVRQLQRQFPTRFEFNERFLRRLYYHTFSCQYGTFLYNSEKQRRDSRVDERAASVWGYFLSRRPEFTNPDYDAVVDDRDKRRSRLILANDKDIRWWHQLFNRSDAEMNAHLDAAEKALADRAARVAALNVPSRSETGSPALPATPTFEQAELPASASAPASVPISAAASVAALGRFDSGGLEDVNARVGLGGSLDGAEDVRDPRKESYNGSDTPTAGNNSAGFNAALQGLSDGMMRAMSNQQPVPIHRPDQELQEMT